MIFPRHSKAIRERESLSFGSLSPQGNRTLTARFWYFLNKLVGRTFLSSIVNQLTVCFIEIHCPQSFMMFVLIEALHLNISWTTASKLVNWLPMVYWSAMKEMWMAFLSAIATKSLRYAPCLKRWPNSMYFGIFQILNKFTYATNQSISIHQTTFN